MDNSAILSKSAKISFIGKSSIRHIRTVIRHMWRVANGLDNAAIDDAQDSAIYLKTDRLHTE